MEPETSLPFSIEHAPLFVSGTRRVRYTPIQPICLRSIWTLCSHLRLGLSSGFSPPGFRTKTLYAFVISPIRVTRSVRLILLHLWSTQITKQLTSASRYFLLNPIFTRTHPLLPYIFYDSNNPRFIHPEDGNYNSSRNVGKCSVLCAAELRKPVRYIVLCKFHAIVLVPPRLLSLQNFAV
jgi:hypothetical protein